MNDVLARICARRQDDVAALAAQRPLAELRAAVRDLPPARSLLGAAASARSAGRRAFIAEIKRASPSRGLIDGDVDPGRQAAAYAGAGAVAISVLTEPHEFLGSDDDLRAARAAAPETVLLRKDFTVDPWQIWEARLLGADVILLLVNVLGERLEGLLEVAEAAGLEALVETHDAEELALARQAGARIIGVNARNLRTFETRLEWVEAVIGGIPGDCLAVAESGIHSLADVERLEAAGAGAFLVGEALMRSGDPAATLRDWGAGG